MPPYADLTPRVLFDTDDLDHIRERLGPTVASRIRRDRPTLCDLIAASHLLGRDPLTCLP